MKKALLFNLLFLFSVSLHAQVGIGNTTPDPSAVLDITSKDQGVLIPRMGQDIRNTIPKPATGLLIYQTDNTPGFYYYNGSGWVSLNGQGLANGTAGGQIYVTDATSPYAPQSPKTVTGDVTITYTGATSITNGAVTTSKIGATGVPAATNYLRGDGTWSSVISTAVFNSPVGSISGNSTAYQFAGNPVTIILTTSKQVTATAVASMGFTSGSYDRIAVGMCFQQIDGSIQNFSGQSHILHRFVNERRTYSATDSITLPAGTYKIGLGVANPSSFVINNNDFANGWVMYY